MSARSRIPKHAAEANGPALARLFSSQVMAELATSGHSPLASRILRETGSAQVIDVTASLGDAFDRFLELLLSEYRSEYVYKNAIANKILLGRHSLNTAFMMTELRVLDCVADVVLLNGSSSVYEIKSEFDSKARLQAQVSTYLRAFDFVNVLTSPSQQRKILADLDERAGILVLTDRNTIRTARKPTSCRDHVDPRAVFSVLRRPEYVAILRDEFGSAPEVPNTEIHQVCEEMFSEIPPRRAHDSMVRALRARGECESLRHFIQAMPKSLKAASLACRLSWPEQSLLVETLNSCAGTVFASPSE